MPRYYFNLRDTTRLIPDREGTELADERSARDHAVIVAREVMRNRSTLTRSWRLQVCDAGGSTSFELLFASVAPELDYYPAEFRELVQRKSHAFARLADQISEVHDQVLQTRALLARADGLPYLAAVNGRRV
jgi:hypothetical protein